MTERNKIYSAADFERYHSGVMPVNEMHELEKAVLEDPFLADALEGYPYTSSFENDTKELRERLNEKQKKKNVFSISSFTQSSWWRIAALFIILAGGGYFFYKLNHKNKENTIASNTIKSISQKKDSAIGINDTASSTNNIAFENHQSSNVDETKKNTLRPDKPLAEKEAFASNKSEATLSSSPERTSNWTSKSDSVRFTMTTGKIDKPAALQFLLKGKVTDENGKPLAFAIIKNKSRKDATVTDTSGNFLLASPDSNTKAIVSEIGYEAKQVTLQKDKEPVIAMNKSESKLDEVVVTGYGQTKKLKDTTSVSQELKSKVSGLALRNQSISTATNSEKFNEYLKENITPVFDEKNNKLTGEVLLSFKVNKKRRPQNIKVVKSSCVECEAEAISLLENGPDWINKKPKQQTVLIMFQY